MRQLEETDVGGVISEGGERLSDFLDGTNVETRWLADHHVIWQTGQPNGPAEGDPAHHTHCSAYVAAAALDLDIYILRPPNHEQLQLANAQVSWLGGVGTESGPTATKGRVELPRGKRRRWCSRSSHCRRQRWEARGRGVSRRRSNPMVRRYNAPDISSLSDLRNPSQPTKPQVVTAGVKNFKSASMKFAFGDHALAWPREIQLFVHDTALE
jgi:hypothetical protein